MLVSCLIIFFFLSSGFHGFPTQSPAKKQKSHPSEPPLFGKDPTEVFDPVYDQRYTLLQPSKMLTFSFNLSEDYETEKACEL